MAGARHRNVFFDVLGTLLTEDEVPRPRAREAFLRLKGEGHELYLWSSGGAGYAAGAAAACEHRKNWPADTLEQATRQYVLNLLGNPEVMRRQVEPVVQEEIAALRNPEQKIRAWAGKLAEIDRLRVAYQRQQAEGLMPLEELRTHLSELDHLQ